MFAATVNQVINTLGRDTLFPVPSVETADNISPLRLVIREPVRKWIFWKKYKHYTTEFGLKDILEDAEDLKVVETAVELTTYNTSTEVSLKGKFGVQLIDELLDVDLKRTKSVIVESQLDLEKVEVHLPTLVSTLKNRKINLKSSRINSLVSQNRKIVGIVTGVIRLMNDATLSCKLNIDGSANVDFKSLTQGGAEIDSDKSKSIKLFKGTPLAYTKRDLLINTCDGSFQIVLEHGAAGGFTKNKLQDFDEVDSSNVSRFYCLGLTASEEEIFKGIMDLDQAEKDNFLKVMREIMNLPKLVQPISELLQRVETFTETGIKRTTNLATLNSKIGTAGDDLVPFLTIVGFHTDTNGDVEYPQQCSELLETSQLLISLLEELDDKEIHSLSNCIDDSSTSITVLQILKKCESTDSEVVTLTDEEKSVLSTDTAKMLTDALEIKVEDDKLTFSKDNIGIRACRLILQAFYGAK